MKKIFLVSLGFIFLSLQCAFSKPPQELKFEPLKFTPPQVERRVLSNGATLFLLADHELPLIQLSAMIRTGSMYDPSDKIGLASICGTMIRAGGTLSKKADEIDEALEFIGAAVETGMDTELGSATLSVLKKDLDQGLAIFGDVLMHPAFDDKKLEIEKAKVIEGIRRRNDEPFQIARREFRKLIYGPMHPLSWTMEIPVVKKISRKDLINFYSAYFHPNNMMIAVSGDFDPDAMVKKLDALFKDWKPSPVVFPPAPSVNPGEKSGKKIVGYAEKQLNQSSIIIGHLGIKRHNPDHFALEVMNEILGGSSFTSRLYKEVRSRLGLAYWVGSSFSEPWDYGTIACGGQTKSQTVGKTIKAILQEIQNIREKEVPEDELKSAKDSIVNSFVFRYASSHAIVSQKMNLEYYGFPPDYLETYTDNIAKVSAKDVLSAAQKYFKPEVFNFMIVGNQKDFDIPLSELGAEVRSIDIKIPE